MDEEIGEYRKLQIKQYPARDINETAEEKYWRNFKAPVTIREVGAVTHIDFSKQKPYKIAVTASTRVIVYDSNSRKALKTYTRFKDKAYSGSFRIDGKLVVAGGEDGVVQVFDGKTLLRQLKGHQKPVRVARFSPDKTHILSCGDDATVRYWDITSGELVRRLDGHTDYVRAAAVSPADSNIWATGGYDHICRLWNVEEEEACMTALDHGSPIEDVAFYPSGAMLVTAGGSEVRVWTILSGGSLVARLTTFQKTVTCVFITPIAGPDSEASARLLAGSLDGHVRVFELDSLKLKHTAKYPGAVMSLGLSEDCRSLAVGLSDGTLILRRHLRKRPPGVPADAPEYQKKTYKPRLDASNYRYFVRGQSDRAGPGDHLIGANRRKTLQPFDILLKKFLYRDALDSCLGTGDPVLVVSILEELASRNGLQAAIGGRDMEGLLLLLRFVCKYITDPRYTRLLIAVSHIMLDCYASEMGTSEDVLKKFTELRQRLLEEAKLQEILLRLKGSLEPILASRAAHPTVQ